MRYFILFIIIKVIFPELYAQDTASKWYKGNTHTHSYRSDGNDFPEMIMDWYKSHGYNFICLSDHNILAHGEKWKVLPDTPLSMERFNDYLKKYGDDWVKYRKNPEDKIEVKLKTLEEYRPLFEKDGEFLIIQAEEITDHYEGKPVHLNVVNNKDLIKPQGGNNITEVIQNNLDAVYEQREKTGQPMFSHLNHPNFRWAISVKDMMDLEGERFFEIFNGHPSVNNYGDSVHAGTEEIWDSLLVHYINNGKPLLYGLATDDAHHYLEHRTGRSNPGRGWIMVRAKELTASAFIEAMETGNFYASTGVELEDIEFRKNKLTIKVKEEQGIDYTVQFIGAKNSSGAKSGIILKEVKNGEAFYKLSKNDLYVRAKIISSKLNENPFAEGDAEVAWTQPVTIK